MGVIREDVVQVSYEVENNPFSEILAEIEALKSQLGGIDDTDGIKNIAKDADGAAGDLKDMASEAKRAAGVDVDGLAGGLKDVEENAEGGGKKSKNLFQRLKEAAGVGFDKTLGGLKKVANLAGTAALNLAKISAKGLVAGVGAAAVAVGGLVTKSVQAYADYEQLVGGVETLFGKSAPIVQKYANNAFKTAGLSANEYMETVTSFSASLLQSVGGDTKKAAKYADMAISDMSDNANKMGTDMGSIQTAYQGFAKQNYTMLDNLKLGYGGTKEEMARLVKDAAKIDKSVDANSMSYANIVKAIHAVQDEMGITGTTAKEAEKTISGSLASMKSAWGNMLTSLVQGGDSFEQSVKNLVSSVKTFAGNIMPAIKSALSGVASLIEELVPMIAKEVPALLLSVLPSIVNAAVSMVQCLIEGIRQNQGTLISTVIQLGTTLLQAILQFVPQIIVLGVELIIGLAQGIAQALPQLIPQLVQAVIGLVQSLIGLLPQFIDAGIQLLLGLVQGILSAVPQLIAAIPQLIKGLISGITQSLPQIIDAAIEIIDSLISGMLDAFPQIIDAGIQLIQALIEGIAQNLPVIVQGALQIINTYVQGLTQYLPMVIQGALSLITALVQGLLQNLPMIIQAALQLINGLVTGLIQQLPMLVQMGFQLVFSLIDGLIGQLPMIINAAVQLLVGLVVGLLQNLPLLIQTGIQLIISLVGGLLQAIPEIIAAIPQIVGAIIDGLMSVDWLQVGKDIIGGVWNGVKSLFGGGKDSGKQAVNSLASGLSSTAPLATGAASTISSDISSNLKLPDATGLGSNAITEMASGITASAGATTTASQSNIDEMSNAFNTGFENIKADTKAFSNDIISTIKGINLVDAGANAMRGLNKGMLGMKASVMATARSIARSVSNTINSELDIHSPSRVLEGSGENSGLGLVKGLGNMRPQVERAASGLSTAVSSSVTPYKPEGTTNNTSNSNVTNNYSPQFTLNMNGASATPDNKRKVKQWISEALDEYFDSLGGANPQVTEV